MSVTVVTRCVKYRASAAGDGGPGGGPGPGTHSSIMASPFIYLFNAGSRGCVRPVDKRVAKSRTGT